MPGKCWKWLKWLEIARNYWHLIGWLGKAGNDSKLQEMAANCCKWLELPGNSWKFLDMQGTAGN